MVTEEVCTAGRGDTETQALGNGREQSAMVWTLARIELMVISRVLSLNFVEKPDWMGSVVVGLELRSDGEVDKGACNREIIMVLLHIISLNNLFFYT